VKRGKESGITIFLLHELEQGRGEVVPELAERVAELAAVDASRAVAVEVLEDVLPVLEGIGVSD
jgi:hypothetical protein